MGVGEVAGRKRPLSDDDHQLSMRTSRRARQDPDDLRSLLVHRLRNTLKAVCRLPLRGGSESVYCEPCNRWTPLHAQPPSEWTCPRCSRRYAMEYAVYAEVDPD